MPSPIAVFVGVDDETQCIVKVNGEARPTGWGYEELRLRLANVERSREVHLQGNITTPYRCVGGVIFNLQRLGFQRIGFISEPAPR